MIAAPIVVGMATKPSVPLQELGLPKASAATTEARVASSISNVTKTEEIVSVSNTTNVTERTIEFSAKQLQKKYKHADVFGITENYTPANAARFQTAVEQHISNPATKVIQGTYRTTNSVTHFVNPQTGVNVLRDASGHFHSAWKLNAEQLQNVLNRGSL